MLVGTETETAKLCCAEGKLEEKQDNPDIVIFGHEHSTAVQHFNGILFVNPGSPTFLHYVRGLGTIGILNLDSGEADVRILQL